jgi:prepilin-type N-terminal cleavage/methylation domain-containing protein
MKLSAQFATNSVFKSNKNHSKSKLLAICCQTSYARDMIRRGFTVVELIITITIMGILLLLTVINVNASQVSARDNERAGDVEAIGSNLETVYGTGVVSGGSPPTISNLIPNPSLKVDATGWVGTGAGGSATNTRVATGGPANLGAFWRRTVTATFTSSPTNLSATSTGTSGVPVTGGQTYTLSAYARTSFPISSGFRLDVAEYDGAGTSLGSSNGTTVTPITNTWLRLNRTFTVGASTAYIRVNVAFSGPSGAGPGETFDVTGFMVTPGSILYDFNDGNSAGWGWTGAANNSASSGPAVATESPGGYPSVSMLSSLAMLEATLPNADPDIFLPPAVTDPMLGLVIATNNTQTTTGVTPQPTTSQYVYQPIDSRGLLCTNMPDCRKFNIYYRLEKDSTVYMVTSKNQ